MARSCSNCLLLRLKRKPPRKARKPPGGLFIIALLWCFQYCFRCSSCIPLAFALVGVSVAFCRAFTSGYVFTLCPVFPRSISPLVVRVAAAMCPVWVLCVMCLMCLLCPVCIPLVVFSCSPSRCNALFMLTNSFIVRCNSCPLWAVLWRSTPVSFVGICLPFPTLSRRVLSLCVACSGSVCLAVPGVGHPVKYTGFRVWDCPK